jgi:hypothetical protein
LYAAISLDSNGGDKKTEKESVRMRYTIIYILGLLIVLIVAEIIGDYSPQLQEILSMNIVLGPVAFVVMIILEGIYQIIRRFYPENNSEEEK